jgi:hypothetical protein
MTHDQSLPDRLATAAQAQANALNTPGRIVADHNTRFLLTNVPVLLLEAEDRIRELEGRLATPRRNPFRAFLGAR